MDDSVKTPNGEETSVRDVLKSKHPVCQPVQSDSVIQGEPPEIHPVIFDSIDAQVSDPSA